MVRPVSTTTLTFDCKSEKFNFFEDLFHTMIKMLTDMTETMKINHPHSLLRKNASKTFRNINTANRQTLEDLLAVFRQKYVNPESQATAKHKWHKLVFDPNTLKLFDFLEELNQGAEKAFGENTQAKIDSLLYAKLPPKLKRSVNMARLENPTDEEIVTHLERELELNGLEEGDDSPVPTMSTAPTATRPGTGLLSSGIDPNITCNYCKKPGHVKDDCRKLKKGRKTLQWRAGYQKRMSKMSNLRQNEPSGGTMLERRWIPPQAQKFWTGGHHSCRYVHQSRWCQK